MSVTQTTLDGSEANFDRQRPETMLWCAETEQWVLRSQRSDWPYSLYQSPGAVAVAEDSEIAVDGEGEDDEAEKVGGVYDITLSYSVDYRLRVPAWSEHEAEERAKELVVDATPADRMHVHTDRREVKELYEDSGMVPDDYDPYGATPLWEAVDDDSS